MRSPVLLLSLCLACAPPRRDEAPPPAAPAPRVQAIAWQAWSPAAFEQARREGRMILVDVGIEGCTACRWMDEKTYADPEVAALVSANFVTISVDAEARPDVGERYEYWGWPATIFMSPAGEQVLAIRGNKLPKSFLPILHQLLDAQAKGTLTAEDAAIEVPPQRFEGPLEDLRATVVARMDRAYDQEQGGWGRFKSAPKDQVRHAFLRAHARGETRWAEAALQTLDAATALLDDQWGGIFVASFEGWTTPVPEKRIAGQAAAMRGFSEALRITGDPRWRGHAQSIDRYVRSTFTGPDGTFFTSQEDVAPELAEGMSARDYYALPGDERGQYGIPPVDHAVYTSKNAAMIQAYVALAEATGQAEYLDRALVAARHLVQTRQTEEGWFRQLAVTSTLEGDDRMRPLPPGERAYLAPQGPMGLAMLDLYRVTADPAWLARAERVAQGLLATLADEEQGGFFDTDDGSTDHVVRRRKSIEANAQAGQLLLALSVYTKNEAYRAAAERTARAVADPERVKREGIWVAELAILLDLLVTGHVEVSVVGERDDPRAAALHAAALEVYEPRKILHYEGPGRYPDQGQPAIFVCNEQACSPPVLEPEGVAAAMGRFAGIEG